MINAHVILVGNYASDAQESMLRFSSFLHNGLRAKGISCEVLQPNPKISVHFKASKELYKWAGYIDKFILHPSTLVKRIQENPSCIVHICDHSNAIYTKHIKNTPHLVTCHDIIAIKTAQGKFKDIKTRFTGKVFQKIITQGLLESKIIACDSLQTQRDLENVLGIDKLKTRHVPLSTFYPYSPMPRDDADIKIAQAIPEFQPPPPPFILHVGSDAWYKNRIGALHIYKSLQIITGSPDKMVFVGPPPSPIMQKYVKDYDLENHVHFIHDIDSKTLRAFYSRAELLLFPSREEGFGLPILEAMACGCRVLTTNKAPMTEIGGTAAYYIPALENSDSKTTAKWAQVGAITISQLIEQSPEARSAAEKAGILHAQTFSQERVINDYINLYQSILAS